MLWKPQSKQRLPRWHPEWTPRLVPWSFGALMLAVLLTGLGALVLGGHDALFSERPAERLLGVIIAVSGLSSLTAIALIWQGRAGLAALGFALGTLPGFALTIIQASFDHSPWTVCWLLISAAPAVAAIVTLLFGRPGGGRPSDTVLAAVVAAVTTVAVPAAGLLVTALRPSSDAQKPDVRLDMTLVAERTEDDGKRYALVDIRVEVANIGKKALTFLASRYSAKAVKAAARDVPTQTKWRIGQELTAEKWTGRYEEPGPVTLIETSFRFVMTGEVLEPGQHVCSNFLVYVPAEKFNTVQSSITLITAVTDRLHLDENDAAARIDYRKIGTKYDLPVKSIIKITPTSWAARLTRGTPRLAVNSRLMPKDEPASGNYTESSVRVAIGHDLTELNKNPDSGNGVMQRFYGVNYTDVGTQLAIDGWRPEGPPAR